MSNFHGYKVGFSGTREGMTAEQRKTFREFITILQPQEFHHGDCIGADAQADEMVHYQVPECEVIIHPPTAPTYRAWCTEGLVLPLKPYLQRNRDIVDATGLLIITANKDKVPNPIKGGTFYTYNYAFSQNRIVVAISVKGYLRFGHLHSQGAA